MNKPSFAPRTIRLEQLEPRYLLSNLPLVQNQAHYGDSLGQNRVGSTFNSSSPAVQLSIFSGSPYAREPVSGEARPTIFPGAGIFNSSNPVLDDFKGRTPDRDDPDNDGDDDDGVADRDDLQNAAVPIQYLAESNLVYARSLSNGNPMMAVSQDAESIASAGSSGFGRVSQQSWPPKMDTALSLRTHADGGRSDNASTSIDFHFATPLERSGSLPGALTFNDTSSAQPLARPAAPASSTESTAARLVSALGHLSVVDASALEKSIQQFLDRVQDAARVSLGEGYDDGILPWIAAATAVALACEVGRRQMHRAWRADSEDNVNRLRDVLFLNADSWP